MKEILKFEDFNVTFSLLIDDLGNLIYKKCENENASCDLTNKEKELINQVFYHLFPSKMIKDLGRIRYGLEKINHFYDLDNHFHIFCEGDKITEACIKLSAIFNSQEEYVALANKRNYPEKYMKRRVKVGKKIFFVVVSSAFLLTSCFLYIKGVKNIVSLVDNHRYQMKVEEYQNRQIQLEEIRDTINNNPNLTVEEKNFFLSCPAFFEDQLEYFDYYTVLDHLKRLRVEYIKERKDPFTYGEFINTGLDRGLIKIYGSTCFEDAPKFALSHEFLHAFTKLSTDDNCFREGLNVLFNNEYFGSLVDTSFYDNGYAYLRQYTYILCEIIPEEALRAYQANNDITLLVQALQQIIPNENMAIKLLTDMDFVGRGVLLKNTDMASYLKLEEEITKKSKEIQGTLQVYCETKYQISIVEDNYLSFWFHPYATSTKIASELELDFHAIQYADEFTKVQQYKRIFQKTGNDNLVLSICNQVKEVQKDYTLEEVLNGDTGLLYKSQEEIDLPILENGKYLGVTYEPFSYIDYEVLSYSDLLKSNKKEESVVY